MHQIGQSIRKTCTLTTFRNIYKFRQFKQYRYHYHSQCHHLPIISAIYAQHNSFTRYHLSQIRRITHQKPDPAHRVYATARTPKYTNRWLEKIILSLCLSLGLIPLGFMYYYYDGTVPITNRRRFLIIPLWLDEMVGVYSLQALGIGVEDEDTPNPIKADNNSDTDDTNNNTDIEIETETQIEPNADPYHMKTAPNKGAMLSCTDHRVAHIESIFDRILTNNYLKKPVFDIEEDNNQYIECTPSHLKQFHAFNWKINIIDKLSVVNAMCVPGGKMVVYTGILKEVVANDNECAAIISHEIGHAICRHGIEQMQFTLFIIACTYLTASLIGIDLSMMVERVMMFGINLLLKLPMSRKAELEADEIAIYLMKNAGYDLDALITVMRKLGDVENRIGHLPEIMSTHPLTESRVKILEEKVKKAKLTQIECIE